MEEIGFLKKLPPLDLRAFIISVAVEKIMGKRARVIITAEDAFLPLFPKIGERMDPMVVDRSIKSDFLIYSADKATTERNLEVSEREERRVPFPKYEKRNINRAVISITFMDHRILNMFTLKKKGMMVTSINKARASYSLRREEATLERIKATIVEKGFIPAMRDPRILPWEGDILHCPLRLSSYPWTSPWL